MKKNHIVGIILFISLSSLNAQLLNIAPVANAGKSIEVYPGLKVNINGGKSWDLNRDSLSYEWAFPLPLVPKDNEFFYKTDTARIKGMSSSIDYAKTYTESFSLIIPENLPPKSKYVVFLRVKDPLGLSSVDSFKIEILKKDDDAIALLKEEELNKKNKKNKKVKKTDISIFLQGLNRNSLSLTQSESINDIIFKILSEMGLKNTINANYYMADSLYPVWNVDSINADIKSGYDTLSYNQNCLTDSCAATNAVIHDATYVLTWNFNSNGILSLHFFNAKDYLKNIPEYFWSSFSLPFDTLGQKNLALPRSIAVDQNNNLYLVNSSDNSIYFLSADQRYEKISIKNSSVFPKSPYGIDISEKGVLYISDKEENLIYKYENQSFEVLNKNNTASSIIKRPSALRVTKNGSVAVICEGDQSVRLVSPSGRSSTILNPGVVEGMTDIAIDNNGSYYIVSPSRSQVFKIVNSRKVEPIAGMKDGFGLKGNAIPAKEAVLIDPISIDFDQSGKLYIAEKGKNLIRYIDKNLIYTIKTNSFNWNGKNSKKYLEKFPNISNLRTGKNSNIYIAQMIEKSISCISINEKPTWLGFDNFINPMALVHKHGIIGLEDHLSIVVPKIMKGYAPRQKKSFRKRMKSFNNEVGDFINEKPILFAVLLLLGSQATSSMFDGPVTLDTPPDWPF